MATSTVVLNHEQIEQKINRIAFQVYENHHEEKEILLAGIVPNGYVLAERLKKKLMEISPIKVELVKIKMNKQNPLSEEIIVNVNKKDLTDKVVIVVDDVLNSGKTLIYGVNHFLTMPLKYLRTAVLVDRSHKKYPINADYVGLSLSTTLQEHIFVELSGDNKDQAYLK